MKDHMVTMHDVLDAQWQYDNTKDGKKQEEATFMVGDLLNPF
jgi:hypothetical protein